MGKTFKCETCDKCYTRKNHLVRHLKTHSGEKTFKCETCKTFKCETCDKCYTRKDNLVTHLKTHSGVKPYSYSVCSKSFLQSGVLDEHMRKTHKTCRHCGKSCSDLRLLRQHELT